VTVNPYRLGTGLWRFDLTLGRWRRFGNIDHTGATENESQQDNQSKKNKELFSHHHPPSLAWDFNYLLAIFDIPVLFFSMDGGGFYLFKVGVKRHISVI
jgi:hypothetical protein